MKTSSKTLDGPETKSKHITGRDLTNNNASEKAGSYFLKVHHNSEISSNQIFSLKRKLTLLITIAIALAAFLMTACEPDPEPCINCVTVPSSPDPNTTPPTDQIAIRSIHPSAGAPGSKVTIVLENYSNATSDQYVTFGPSSAEVIYARYGMMIVRVPMDLKDGDYQVNIRSNGQVARAPQEFKVIKGTD
ncbi:MAG TPA: IPT/TIG domain-containing protein [Chryseolinea sp.]|nr:IPT/TIG domain-containing protein [Chryseolinea sp.]